MFIKGLFCCITLYLSLFFFQCNNAWAYWSVVFFLHSDGPDILSLKISPSQEYYESGSNITLSCSAVSKPSALYYWFLNGSEMPHTGSVISIQINESGNYSCQAFNQKTLRYDTSSPLAVTVFGKFEYYHYLNKQMWNKTSDSLVMGSHQLQRLSSCWHSQSLLHYSIRTGEI